MFSDPIGKVTHFGIWADETSSARRCALAFSVLVDALDRCRDQDMQTDEVEAALRFLSGHATRSWQFRQFWRALATEHPESRWQNVNAALHGIRAVLGDLLDAPGEKMKRPDGR